MTRRRLSFLTLVASCLVAAAFGPLTGCSRNPVATFSQDGRYLSPQRGPGLVANPEGLIPDVPVPIGFKLVVASPDPEAELLDTIAARDLRHVYQGRAPLADVRLFYVQQTHRRGWTLEDQSFSEFGEFSLMCRKGGELLVVRSKQEGKRTTVVITIDPA